MMSNTEKQLEWEPVALAKYNDMIQRIPLFHREIAQQAHKDVKPRKKKRKLARGVKPRHGRDFLIADMRAAGLQQLAGGPKYQYWGIWGGRGVPGIYIRLAKKTARIVSRRRRYEQYRGHKGPLEDHGVTGEIYYGQIAENRDIAKSLIAMYLKRAEQHFAEAG